jgi:hypothetical protein
VVPATGDKVRCSSRRCSVQRSEADCGLGVRVVCRGGLLGIEGFAVRVGFDPDRRPQPLVLAAVNRRGRQLLLEVLDPLKSGVHSRQASDDDVALHPVSLLAHGHPRLFNRALRRLPWAFS